MDSRLENQEKLNTFNADGTRKSNWYIEIYLDAPKYDGYSFYEIVDDEINHKLDKLYLLDLERWMQLMDENCDESGRERYKTFDEVLDEGYKNGFFEPTTGRAGVFMDINDAKRILLRGSGLLGEPDRLDYSHIVFVNEQFSSWDRCLVFQEVEPPAGLIETVKKNFDDFYTVYKVDMAVKFGITNDVGN